MRFAWIAEERKAFPLSVLCRVLGASESGFRKFVTTRPKRTLERLKELEVVRQVHRRHREVNGSRRNAEALKADGVEMSRGKVRRIMKEAQLQSRHPRPFRVTTVPGSARRSPDLVEREFSADRPDQAWVSDITYLRTGNGWLYLCVMLDLFSRRVVGWSTSTRITTDLVERALRAGIRDRGPGPGLVVHSDQGCQYTSRAFRRLLARHGYQSSMGSVGTCWDNAVAESFFATLKKESGYCGRYEDHREALEDLSSYIEIFYNTVRLHSYLGYQSPSRFEAKQPELARAA